MDDELDLDVSLVDTLALCIRRDRYPVLADCKCIASRAQTLVVGEKLDRNGIAVQSARVLRFT